MAAPKRASDSDYLFDMIRLNRWFGISGLLLLAAVLAMIRHDYDREWKEWQRRFRSVEIEHTEAAIRKIDEALSANPEYRAAVDALAGAEESLRKNEAAAFEVRRKIAKLEGRRYVADTDFKEKKAEFDALRYETEEAEHAGSPKAAALRKTLGRLQVQVSRAKVELERTEEGIRRAQKELEGYTGAKERAEAAIYDLTATQRRLAARRKKIRPSFVNDFFRDLPLLDFIDPMLKIKQVVAGEMREDLHFVKVPRVDNCPTCHVAIDRPGFEEEPNPLKSHPNLALFLGTKSKHPVDDYGCTICHAGMGGGLTFTTAAHTPRDETQAAQWKEKYGWHRMAHWSEPMLPLPATEGTCYGCHQRDYEVPRADKLNRAVWMVERFGCYGCHKIEGWDYLQKTGPSLKRAASKLAPDFLHKWIRDPKAFRPTTHMPQIFDLSNSSDPASLRRNTAEIRSIVTYLLEKSEPWRPGPAAPAGGDPERGKEIFGSVGCLGCHNIDDFPSKVKYKKGPELSGIGSKAEAAWLAGWLRNPKDYWPETRMPSLRLSEREISDLVSYLLGKRDRPFEARPAAPADGAALREAAFDHLKSRMPVAEARKTLASMTDKERQLYVAEKAIWQYGCFACHTIAGFEETKPIGPELTYIASKPLSQIDFGFVPVERTVEAYIYRKIMDPRSFDEGKVKEPLERSRMPWFDFTPEEGRELMTLMLGLRKYSVPEDRKPKPTTINFLKGDGRKLQHHYQCRGCHIVEGIGGDILEHYEDPSQGPPNLQGEGRKVQQNWLYHFLGAPTPIRPWLKVRMPTFGFTHGQLNTFIGYFRAIDDDLPVQVEVQPRVVQSPEERRYGELVFRSLACPSCHVVGPPAPGRDTSNLAPDLAMAHDRLRYEWVPDWLRTPQKLLPGTRMPNLFYSDDGTPLGIPIGGSADPERQIRTVRDYIFTLR